MNIPSHYLTETYFDPWTPRLIELVRQFQQGNPVPSRFKFATITVLPDSSQMTYPFRGRISEMYEHADSNLVEAMLQAQFNPYKLNEVMRMERALQVPCNLLVPLDFFKFYSEKYGFEPVVVFIPCRHQVSDKYLPFEHTVSKKFDRTVKLTRPEYQINVQLLKKHCSQLGLNLIDASDTLSQMEGTGVRAFWNYDDHMRHTGYRAVGKHIANETRQLLTP